MHISIRSSKFLHILEHLYLNSFNRMAAALKLFLATDTNIGASVQLNYTLTIE